LFGVAAVSPDDIWAVGDWSNVIQGGAPLFEHWNGQQWSVMSTVQIGQGSGLQGVAAAAANDV
jgi:hypothetical protein